MAFRNKKLLPAHKRILQAVFAGERISEAIKRIGGISVARGWQLTNSPAGKDYLKQLESFEINELDHARNLIQVNLVPITEKMIDEATKGKGVSQIQAARLLYEIVGGIKNVKVSKDQQAPAPDPELAGASEKEIKARLRNIRSPEPEEEAPKPPDGTVIQ